MKKLIFLFLFVFLISGLMLSAQSPFQGFFKPLPDFTSIQSTKDAGQSVWLFRPAVTISAIKFTYMNEEGNPWEMSNFSNMGAGLSYQHFINNDGNPYNNFGFSLFALFNNYPMGEGVATMSIATTVNLYQYWNFGTGYDFGVKKVFILTGITYSFN